MRNRIALVLLLVIVAFSLVRSTTEPAVQSRTAARLQDAAFSGLDTGNPPNGSVRHCYACDIDSNGVATSGTRGMFAMKLDDIWKATALDGGAGTGSVTSIGASGPAGLLTWSSAVTTSGTLTATLSTQTTNTVFASLGGVPTFRALLAADLPNTSVTPGAYTTADITVDAQGRITAAATGSGGGGGGVSSVSGTTPIASSGGATPAISIANAMADGTTKGAATFTAAEFNSTTGLISLDYTNAQSATTSLKGFLTAADWTTFNNKQSGPLTGDVTTSGAAATIANSSVTYAKMQNVSANSRLLGIGDSGAPGAVREITVGSGLTMTGVTLSASGSGLPTSDSTSVVEGSADGSKELRFEVDGFTTGTVRVLTPPNYDGTIATLAGTETFSAKTLTTPTIASFVNATHNHLASAGGGVLDVAAITSGVFAKARQHASTVYNDQANTFSTGVQSFVAADLLIPRRAAIPGTPVAAQIYQNTSDNKPYFCWDASNCGDILVAGLSSPLSPTMGGTGVALTDPNADRIIFWDDSAGAHAYLTPGTGLSITGTTINATAAITGADTLVVFMDGANTPSVDTGFSYNKTTNTLTVGALNVGDGTVTSELLLPELVANGTDYFSWLGQDSRATTLRIRIPAADPTAGQLMAFSAPSGGISTATWVAASAGSGTITAGVTNVIPKYTASTTIDDSLLSDNATTLTYTGTGGISAASFTSTNAGAAYFVFDDGDGTLPSNTADAITLSAPASAPAGGLVYLLPSDTPTNGEQLTANISGTTVTLSWDTGGSGGGTPGGSTTQVQYNNAGAFGGITGATTNGTVLTLVAPVLGAATATSLVVSGSVTADSFVSSNTGAAYYLFDDGDGTLPTNVADAITLSAPASAPAGGLLYLLPSDTPSTGEQLTATISGTTVTMSWDASGAGGGITTLEGQTGSSQTFTDDTNVTIVSGSNAHVITWAGLLATSRGGFGLNISAASGVPLFASGAATFTNTSGSGNFARVDSPTFVTPALGTPSAVVLTNATGTASGLTAGNVTTNANLTGHITSTGNATVLGSFTFAQLNTAISDADVARTDAANTFTGVQSMTSPAVTTSLTSPSATFALLNVTPTTINFAGAATTLNIGASATQILNFGGSTTASEFRFLEPSGSGTNYSAFKAVAQGASITYSLPPTVGAAGTVLTDVAGNGVLTWVAGSGGGSGTITAGATNAVPKYTASTTIDDSGVTIDGSNNMTVPGNLIVTGTFTTGDGTVAGESILNEIAANGTEYFSWLGQGARTTTLRALIPTADPTAGQVMAFSAPSSLISTITWITPISAASPTFTGTVTIPTPFTLGAVSVLPTGTELNFVDGVTSAIQTQLDGKQPLDSDLTTIAGLTATTDNFLVSVSSAWASRTVAQVKTTLALNNVENTALSTWAGSANITTLGTVGTGTITTGATLGDVTMNVTGTDATGDIYYRASGGLLTRLGIGSTGQVVTVAAGLPSWATPSGGTITGTDTHVMFFDGANTPAGDAGMTYNKTTDSLTLAGNLAVTGTITAGNGTVAGESILLEVAANGTNYISFLAPDAITNTLRLKFPNADPAAGNVMLLGTPSSNISAITYGGLSSISGTLGLTTQVTGTLPVANGGTGITSLGSGVATFWGTPSSANLAAAVTGETGSGALVFGTSPDFTTAITLGGVAVPTISSTSTFTNKTYDVEGTGNVFTTTHKAWFAAAGCNNATAASFWDLGTSLAPTPVCQNSSSGTTAQNAALDFPDSDGLYFGQATMMLSADFSGTVDAKVRWKAAATSGGVVWLVSTICVADAETDNPSFNTATTFAADTAKGTTLQSNDATATGITITGCAAGELMHVRIARDRTTSGDTIAGVVSFLGLEITSRRAQ